MGSTSGEEPAEGGLRNEAGPRKHRQAGVPLLVVDDDPGVRAAVSALLSRVGYDVSEAESGEKALDLLARWPLPRAVILDRQMPGMQGEDVLREIRARHAPHLVVVILSAELDPAIEDALRKAGADACLHKERLASDLRPLIKRLVPL